MIPKLVRIVTTSLDEGIKSSLINVAFGKETLAERDLGEIIAQAFQYGAKRGTDILMASMMLVISFPIIVVIVFAIKIFSEGPVFFKQQRIGLKGESFTIYKFSTMKPADSNHEHKSYVQELLEEGNETGDNDEILVKYLNYVDSRTTRIGRFLRATSLDELPQLFNILQGHMSVVGPRPHPVYEVEAYKEWYRRRLSVKPGLTGWSKIKLRLTPQNYEESILYDLWYVDNWSILLDIRIILMTVPFLLFSRDAR
jgi:lipopolysaccharide/colanic/teichoic acid biosynthesis glycosyltransferase